MDSWSPGLIMKLVRITFFLFFSCICLRVLPYILYSHKRPMKKKAALVLWSVFPFSSFKNYIKSNVYTCTVKYKRVSFSLFQKNGCVFIEKWFMLSQKCNIVNKKQEMLLLCIGDLHIFGLFSLLLSLVLRNKNQMLDV